MLKVKKNSLLMIACLVWGIAGINILRIGLLAYPAYVTVGNIVCDHGGYDDRRNLYQRVRPWTGDIHCSILFWTWRITFAGRDSFWQKLFQRDQLTEKNSTEMLLNYRKGDKYYAGFWRNFI